LTEGHDGTFLFTGFPGFIGARLLPRLLELMPAARFACLVQERFLALAGDERDRLAREHPQASDRLELVAGDITVPDLGLEPPVAARLRDSLVGAYHLAAVYDLAVTREMAERVNVLGTRHLLAFLEACPAPVRLHYVSTAFVSGTVTGVFRETDLELGQSFNNHYEETKHRAEVEVRRSRVPATVYRPGIVVGDSRTGETAKFDGPYFAMRAMLRVPSPGLFVKVGSGKHPVNVVPVDFIIEALARLSTSEVSRDKTYHLTDPDPLSVNQLLALFSKALGRHFLNLPLPMGLARLLFAPRLVQSYLGLPVQSLAYFDHPCRYDTTLADAELGTLGVSCPRLPDYVDRLVAFFKQRRDEVRRSAMV
jgi:thioester reductase-like protein